MIRDLQTLRRFTLPAAILLGLFLLVSTPRYHLALTAEARAYVLCGFAFLYVAVLSAALPVLGRQGARFWAAVRLGTVAVVAAAFAVSLTNAASPVPPWILITLAVALAASCWFPPRL